MNKKQRKKYKPAVLKLKAKIEETAADLKRRFPNLDIEISNGRIIVNKIVNKGKSYRGVI